MGNDTTQIVLGEGLLSWSRYERVGDRYGSVKLYAEGTDQHKPWPARMPLGTYGSLKALILQTRQSPHIGDLFRGLFPETPEAGEEIVLGEGRLFIEGTGGPKDRTTAQGGLGVAPLDGRDTDWLDPQSMYRCHHQTVKLVFEIAETTE